MTDYVFETNPNEARADQGSQIRRCTPDWGRNDIETDVTDALASVCHYLHRLGLDPEEVFDDALRSAEGDLEDGPEALEDLSIAEMHGTN